MTAYNLTYINHRWTHDNDLCHLCVVAENFSRKRLLVALILYVMVEVLTFKSVDIARSGEL